MLAVWSDPDSAGGVEEVWYDLQNDADVEGEGAVPDLFSSVSPAVGNPL